MVLAWVGLSHDTVLMRKEIKPERRGPSGLMVGIGAVWPQGKYPRRRWQDFAPSRVPESGGAAGRVGSLGVF